MASCQVTSTGDAGAPVAAVDGESSSPGATAPPLDLYQGTRPAAAASGQVATQVFTMPDGRLRGYRMYVPASLAGSVSPEPPLLVALHGGGGSGEQFERTSGFDGLAESNGFVVVYPDGVGSGVNANLRTWNAGSCCGGAAEQQVDDVGFVLQVLARVATTRAFDRRRVFAIGHSNGAMLAYRLACEASDTFAAVGVQAGSLAVPACPATAAVSLLHLHGSDDENVPIGGGSGIGRSSGVTFRPAGDSVAVVASAGGCAPEPAAPVTDSGNEDLRISTWTGCPPGVDAQLIAVDGAAHAWMGHDRGPVVEGLVGEPYADLDASRALWAFVAAHPRA
jgi:polyhydroxybutyrate depolymerase